MTKVLVIQGAGMDMRGKAQVDIFGPETLEEINAQILGHARALGIEVEIFQTNDEDRAVAKLEAADPAEFAGVLINPGGFTTTTGPLPETVSKLTFPACEVHASNPSSRGVISTLMPVCQGAICGFGYAGYELGLRAITNSTKQTQAKGKS